MVPTMSAVFTGATLTSCVDCRKELDHCHGTRIAHLDGGVECTDDRCRDVDATRHRLAIDCTTVDGACCGTRPDSSERLSGEFAEVGD